MNYCIDKNKIHILMKKNNLKTQTELADKIGISKNQLSVILSCKNNPFKNNIQLLSEALNVSPLDIITTPEINTSRNSENKQK